MLGFLLLGRMAHKLVYYTVAILPFALVFFLCRDYFPGWPSLDARSPPAACRWSCPFCSASFSKPAWAWSASGGWRSARCCSSICCSAFSSPATCSRSTCCPQPWHTIVELTPLQYLAYFPAAVFLGKIQGWDLARRPVDRSRLGHLLHPPLPRPVPPRHAALQRLRRLTAQSFVTRFVTHHVTRASYLRVFLTFARNSLVRNMTFRANFLIECMSSVTWMMMNLGFYLLIFQLHAVDRREHRLGQVRVLRLPGDDAARQQPGAGVLHAQLRGVQRADPHRRARFRPAQADRHAVSDLAGKGRLVEPGQLPRRLRSAGRQPVPPDDAARESAASCAADDRCSMPSTCSAAWRFSTA